MKSFFYLIFVRYYSDVTVSQRIDIPSKCPVEVLISLYCWKLNLFGNWTWRNEKWIWQLGWFCQLTATLDDPEYHQIVIQYFSHGWNLKCWYFVSILEAKHKQLLAAEVQKQRSNIQIFCSVLGNVWKRENWGNSFFYPKMAFTWTGLGVATYIDIKFNNKMDWVIKVKINGHTNINININIKVTQKYHQFVF